MFTDPDGPDEIIEAFLLGFPALFSIINPVGGAFVFQALTAGCTGAERMQLAGKVALYSLAVLMISLWAGPVISTGIPSLGRNPPDRLASAHRFGSHPNPKGNAMTTPTILGSGDFRYRLLPDWARLPDGWDFHEVAAVAVDSRDQVYVFSRSAHPVTVFDRDGTFLRAWGEGVFKRAHGLSIAPDDTIFCTDDGDHSVRRCTPEGKILLTLGTPGKPRPYMGGEPFCQCTHTALSPSGEIYVSDGYGNARVHKYTPDGRHILSWGTSGVGKGEFNLPHNICCDEDGWVYVADRENHRVQIFNGQGRYETEWRDLHRPSGLFLAKGRCPYCYVGECGPTFGFSRNASNLGPRVSVVNKQDGTILARLGDRTPANFPGPFTSPHGIAADSKGDIYVGEVAKTGWGNLFPGVTARPPRAVLQKLVKQD